MPDSEQHEHTDEEPEQFDGRKYQGLPEWVWQFRTAWTSTILYQRIRNGISDHIVDRYFLDIKTRTMRKRFSPNAEFIIASRLATLNEDTHGSDRVDEIRPIPSVLYSPLPRASIRMLHVQSGMRADALVVYLTAHSLDALPRYEALSYTWSRDGKAVSITCCSQRVRIQENLFLALSELREPDRERLLWVDAICINQTDEDERSAQVRLMRSIYEKAASVLIWLGTHDSESNQGIELLKSIDEISLKLEKGAETGRPLGSLTPDGMVRIGLPAADSGQWRSLNALLWRPWFTRVWIIQELSVSQNAQVICGTSEIPWTSLSRAASFISQYSLTPITHCDPSRVLQLETFRRVWLEGQDQRQILSLLLEARRAYATDDRDKIFALLGLGEDRSSEFAPDYSKPAARIFTDFSVHHIKQTENLDILTAVEDHNFRLKKGLPSWVADWEVQTSNHSLYSLEQYKSWNASSQLPVSSFQQPDGNCRTLAVRGFIVDYIEHTGDTFLEWVPLPGGSKDWMPHMKSKIMRESSQSISNFMAQQRWRQWERIAVNIRQHEPDTGVSEFIRTLIADDPSVLLRDSPDNADGSPSIEDSYKAWRKYWRAASQHLGKDIPTVYRSMTAAEVSLGVRYMRAHHKAAYGRCFLTTRTRKYMGLGPNLIRRGDLVVILSGGKTPFILRRQDRGSFRFVGACYIHGIMNGEAALTQQAGTSETALQEFTLI